MPHESEMPWVNKIYNTSCISMDDLPNDSIDTCITSPPYFNLRDYGHKDQIGSEIDLSSYIENMSVVFREVFRVLKPTGTCWLNIGETYEVGNRSRWDGIKKKDQMLVPYHVATRLKADGWMVLQTFIWHKPDTMPSPVRDRTAPAHEYIFLLAKTQSYALAKMVQDIPPLWSISKNRYAGLHFATMPREIVRRCVLLGSPASGVVLDPFLGSGTTAEVAVGCGRKFVGYELNQDYCRIAMNRIGLFIDSDDHRFLFPHAENESAIEG